VFGVSLDELESQWLASQQEPSRAENLLNDIIVWVLFFLAGTFLVLILYLATQRKGQNDDQRQ
jgi:hypothetical protein